MDPEVMSIDKDANKVNSPKGGTASAFSATSMDCDDEPLTLVGDETVPTAVPTVPTVPIVPIVPMAEMKVRETPPAETKTEGVQKAEAALTAARTEADEVKKQAMQKMEVLAAEAEAELARATAAEAKAVAEAVAVEKAKAEADEAAKAKADEAAKAKKTTMATLDPVAYSAMAEYEGMCVGFFPDKESKDAQHMAVCRMMSDNTCPAVYDSSMCTLLSPVKASVREASSKVMW